jgi:hypothetical protein
MEKSSYVNSSEKMEQLYHLNEKGFTKIFPWEKCFSDYNLYSNQFVFTITDHFFDRGLCFHIVAFHHGLQLFFVHAADFLAIDLHGGRHSVSGTPFLRD